MFAKPLTCRYFWTSKKIKTNKLEKNIKRGHLFIDVNITMLNMSPKILLLSVKGDTYSDSEK